MCQICLKSAQWFWRRNISLGFSVFSRSYQFLPAEESVVLNLNKRQSHSPIPRILFVKFGCLPSGSGEQDGNVKSLLLLGQRRTMDKFRTDKLTRAFGSAELRH